MNLKLSGKHFNKHHILSTTLNKDNVVKNKFRTADMFWGYESFPFCNIEHFHSLFICCIIKHLCKQLYSSLYLLSCPTTYLFFFKRNFVLTPADFQPLGCLWDVHLSAINNMQIFCFKIFIKCTTDNFLNYI